MKEDLYSDIRPYNDDEIPAALERIVNDPFFVPAVNFAFPDADMERIAEVVRTCKTVEQMQERVMFSIIKRIIETSIDNFTLSGMENIEKGKGYLYISNHRDITLDSFLLQYALFSNGLPTTATTLGDNLLRSQFIIDICRINRAVRVIRKTDDIQPREFLQNSIHLAEYIRWYISQGKSMWIAQRNGRTKDGIDRTDQGIINMFRMSSSDDKVKAIAELNILPVAVSYEWEPCDLLKVMELYISTHHKGTYVKKEGEDLNSILTGIVQPKGKVHFSICKPVTAEDLMPYAELPSNEFNKQVARLLDSRICSEYVLTPNNYIAYDLLHGTDRYCEHYTSEQKETFLKHAASLEAYSDSCDIEDLNRILLGIYANPIDSKNHFTQSL